MFTLNVSEVAAFAALATAIIGTIMSFLVLVVSKNRSRSFYDDEKHRAVLSDVRSSYENQVNILTRQLLSTEDRWKDTNHLLISSQNSQSDRIEETPIRSSKFIQSLGIDISALKIDRRQVFLLTPFSQEERALYNDVQNICAKNGLICVRGDEDHASGDILSHVVRLMLSSRLVIANISSRNANVFYELGVAHAFDKPTILLSNSPKSLPFDIAAQRTILFSGQNDLELKLTQTLLRLFSGDELADGRFQ